MPKGVKREKREEKPDVPWAVRLVVKNEDVVEVKREHGDETKEPWSKHYNDKDDKDDSGNIIKRPVKQARINPDSKDVSDALEENQSLSQKKTASRAQGNQAQERKEPKHWICSQNYAALEAGSKEFGLIPMGVEGGVRTLIMHVAKGKQGWQVFQHVQPGGTIRVVKVRSGGTDPRVLRVRFTAPSQYYPPGAKVSCITIGVDDAEWQSLMTKAHRI
jgi:hypothetical protein